MELQQNYRDDELEKIVQEAILYMCACPCQVAAEIRQLRQLIHYQRNCEQASETPSPVHQAIAEAAIAAHAVMEDCLTRVLEIEGWDRQTLKMPEGLRQLRDEIVARDD
jgi:hypothetical protein